MGTPNDKGEWLRTAESPTDEDHGPVLHLGNIEHAWGKGKNGQRRAGKGERKSEERKFSDPNMDIVV